MATAQDLLTTAIANGWDKCSSRDVLMSICNSANASGSVLSGAVDPTTAPTGTASLYFNTASGALFGWVGSAWQPIVT